jgi:hypothetical protein
MDQLIREASELDPRQQHKSREQIICKHILKALNLFSEIKTGSILHGWNGLALQMQPYLTLTH